jgi:hypothetical protein
VPLELALNAPIDLRMDFEHSTALALAHSLGEGRVVELRSPACRSGDRGRHGHQPGDREAALGFARACLQDPLVIVGADFAHRGVFRRAARRTPVTVLEEAWPAAPIRAEVGAALGARCAAAGRHD